MLCRRDRLLVVLSLSLPLCATAAYSNLFIAGWSALPPAFYGACVAGAATLLESNVLERLRRCVVVVLVSMLFAGTFDAIMILGISIVAGLFAVGIVPAFGAARIWKHAVHRLLRALTAGGITFFALMLPLPTSGSCPAGGGSITQAFVTFSIVTYFPVAGLIVFDFCLHVIGKEQSVRNHFSA